MSERLETRPLLTKNLAGGSSVNGLLPGTGSCSPPGAGGLVARPRGGGEGEGARAGGPRGGAAGRSPTPARGRGRGRPRRAVPVRSSSRSPPPGGRRGGEPSAG